MKRIMIICLVLGLGFILNAQEIKTKKMHKVKVDTEIKNFEFGEKSHLLYLETTDGEEILRYNTRFRSLRSVEAEANEASADEQAEISARAKKKQIIVSYPDGSSKAISPAGDVLYIWVSVSPDQQHLLFKAVAKGCYISDLEGNIVQELGKLNSPFWVGNDWVIGMDEEDDGHQFTSSDIKAFSRLSGKVQNLTADSEEIAIYPAVSPANDRLVFKNEKGELFTRKIKIQ